MVVRLTRQQKLELASQGFVIEELAEWPEKATYYKPNGEAMPNLPADAWSMKRYLQRGFTLTPPLLPPLKVRKKKKEM